MATVTKTFTFNAATQSLPYTAQGGSWAAGGTVGVGTLDTTSAYESTNDTDAGNGGLRMRVTGKNQTGATSYWEWTGTWQDLGVPAGAIVSNIDVDHDWAQPEYTTGAAGVIGPTELRDGAAALLSTIQASGATPSAAQSTWSTRNGTAQAVTGINVASTRTIKIRIGAVPKTGNSNSAAVSIGIDKVVVTVTYTDPSGGGNLTADFETGTNGSNVLASDTGSATAWDNVTNNTNATMTYDNTSPYEGSLSMKSASNATAGSNFSQAQWREAKVGTLTDHYGRFYFKPEAIGTGDRFFQVLNADGSPAMSLQVRPGGIVRMQNASVAAVGSDSTVGLSSTDWNRVEYRVIHSATAGYIEVRLFVGSNKDGTTPDETLTTATTINTGDGATRLSYGIQENQANMIFRYDAIVGRAASWVGPAGTPPISKSGGAVAPASASGTKTVAIAKSSGAISPASANGTKAARFARSNGAVSPASAGGTRAYKIARASGAISVASANGTRAYKVARSGGATSVASASASKAFSAVKSAGAVSPASGGATRLTRAVKAAGAVSPVSGGGTGIRVTLIARSGGAISPASANGTRAYRIARASGAISVASASGTRTYRVARASGAISVTSGSGTRAYKYARSSGAISVASANGTRAYKIVRSSGAISVASANGTKTAIFVKGSVGAIAIAIGGGSQSSSTGAAKNGGAISVASGSATKVWRAVKSNGATSVASASGTRTYKIARSSGAVSVATAGGTRAYRFSRSSGAISVASGGASKGIRVARASGAVSVASGGATRAYSVARSGSGTAIGRAGGGWSTQTAKIGGGISPASADGIRETIISSFGGGISVGEAGGTKGVSTSTFTKDGGAVVILSGGGSVFEALSLPAGHADHMLSARGEGGLITSTNPEKTSMLPIKATATIISARERATVLSGTEDDGEVISAKG